MSRYAYDYSLSPARPTGWRGTAAGVMVVGTVIAVSAISGALVTLQLFASSPNPAAAPQVAAVSSTPRAPQASEPIATRVVALATRATKAASALVARNHVESSATVAMGPTVPAPAAPKVAPPVTAPATSASASSAPASPAPTAATIMPATTAAIAQPAPAPIAESDLTFAKGYAQRQALAKGAPVRHGKVLVASQAQLGRAAIKAKPRVYARNNTNSADRRRAVTARSDAYGMFQRFDRPDQFDFNRHQALAFGEQRAARRRNDAPPRPPYGNSPNGFFGGLF